MWMYFKDKKVKSVTFLQKPDAAFLPMKMLTEADKKLKNFNWQIGRKPLSREEIMWLVERKEEPASPEAPVVNKQKAKTATHQ
jgi:hypothetical protein